MPPQWHFETEVSIVLTIWSGKQLKVITEIGFLEQLTGKVNRQSRRQ